MEPDVNTSKLPIVNAMTVDVEDYFHVAALAKSIDRARWDDMEYRVEANTRRLLNLFELSNIKATFFVLGWVARRSPELIKEIHRRGHEVASHGMSHKLVFNQTPEEFFTETRDSKTMLEDIIGERVEGYRASTYSITRRSLWALDTLCDLGFVYDSSIFPIKHDVYGIPDAPQSPARIRAPNGKTIVEFPMSTSKLMGIRIPVSGGGYFRLLPYAVTRAGLEKLNQAGRPFVFYLHPWEVDPGQPRIKTSALSTFRHYTNLSRCETRLKTLISQFQFSTMKSVLENLKLVGTHEPVEVPAGAPIFAFAR
jgi:polysaccharide deacetylase family protein (PEP-CTERM system associated)